ncbi:tyrosine-type recombinase/integrase [Haliangium sp.]|uniref:tyrosine-type recombinase/integrase n=1 Tax=Haliangium sp. TaxID=2663208 RepID=UPI003D14A33E
MGKLREQMEADLKIGGYSASTRKSYLRYARQYAAYHMRSPAEMGAEEVRRFLLHMVEEQQVSRATLQVVRAALVFLYRVTLNRPMEVGWVPVPRRPKPLPVVLSGTEITALLGAIKSLKYRTLMSALYAAGLRISEGCRLQPSSIDSRRMIIYIRGKGEKDRLTLLSTRLLKELRAYWRLARPEGEWLFPGRTGAGHVSPESVRQVFHKAVEAAGISKKVTVHTLRHSFATHLVETGTDVTVVQTLLGHTSPRTTRLYTHTSIEKLAQTRSPLDLLGTRAASILG